MPALGHLGYAAIKTEATWGTKDVASMEFFEFTSETIAVSRASKIIKPVNNSRVFTKRIQLAKMVNGQIVFEVNPEDLIGRVIKNILPSEVFVDDGVGNGGKHSFSSGNTLPAGLTVQVGRDLDVMDFFGGRVNSLAFESALDETLKCTADFSFKDASVTQVAQTPSYTTQNPLVYHTGTFTIDGTAVPITAFSLTVSGGMKAERKQIGSALIQQQQVGPYAVTGSITAYFDNMTLINSYLNGTAAKIRLQLEGASIGTTLRRIEFIVPTALLNGETPKISGAESEILLTLPFEAVRTGSGSPDTIVHIQLDNSKRSVY